MFGLRALARAGQLLQAGQAGSQMSCWCARMDKLSGEQVSSCREASQAPGSVSRLTIRLLQADIACTEVKSTKLYAVSQQ